MQLSTAYAVGNQGSIQSYGNGILTGITQPGVLLIALGLLTLGLKPGDDLATHTVQLPFEAAFAGASDASSIWAGQVRGQPGGRVRLLLHQVESPLAAANRVWHVEARWAVEESPTRSFTAELEGMVDWRTGVTRLGGVVTSGWMKGAWVQQTGQVVNGDMTGTLQVSPGWE